MTNDEFIFFDVDDVSEEADFIRVDDLFRMEEADIRKLSGAMLFTLVPRQRGRYLTGSLSRTFHRTLIMSGIRLEKPLGRVRIRPGFAQWQLDLTDGDDPEGLIREFREDLEMQAEVLLGLENGVRFWADSCFICPENERISDEQINRLAARFQEPAPGEDL